MITLLWVILGTVYLVVYLASIRMLSGHLAWRMLGAHNETYRSLAIARPSLEQ